MTMLSAVTYKICVGNVVIGIGEESFKKEKLFCSNEKKNNSKNISVLSSYTYKFLEGEFSLFKGILNGPNCFCK